MYALRSWWLHQPCGYKTTSEAASYTGVGPMWPVLLAYSLTMVEVYLPGMGGGWLGCAIVRAL